MNKCEDCGMINPPDIHTCKEYEENLKAARKARTLEQIVEDLERRVATLEVKMENLYTQTLYYSPWRK